MDLAVSENFEVKTKECKKINKYLDLARELKSLQKIKIQGNTNCIWCTRNGPQEFIEETGVIRNQCENPFLSPRPLANAQLIRPMTW